MYVRIGGQKMWLWRAVDHEGEVLDVLVQKSRNRAAALKLLRRLLQNQGVYRSPPQQNPRTAGSNFVAR